MVNETRKAINCDHGHGSKQTMTTIVAVYLPDSPLHAHVVSILCHVCQQSMATVVWQDSHIAATGSSARLCSIVSVNSKSISITFLTAPHTVELTVIDDELFPPFRLTFLWFTLGS